MDIRSTAKGSSFGTAMKAGRILEYYPLKKIYRVMVDGESVKNCRPLHSGLQTAYKVDDRVIILKCGPVGWVLLGTIDKVPEQSEPFVSRSSVDEQFALNQQAVFKNSQLGEIPDFRPVDNLKQKEEPLTEGDTLLENKAQPFMTRAFVKIFSFGDVFIKASDICFIYLCKQKNQIFQKALNFVRQTSGYREEIATGMVDPVRGNTIITETVCANPFDGAVDKRVQTGRIIPPAIVTNSLLTYPATSRGERVGYGEHFISEVDNDTETVRILKTVGDAEIELQAGSLSKEASGSFTTPPTLAGTPVLDGVRVKLGSGWDVVFDSTTNTLAITNVKNPVNSFVLSEAEFRMQRGGQSLVLSDSGLSGVVNNYNMVVSGVSSETVGTAKSIIAGGQSVELSTAGKIEVVTNSIETVGAVKSITAAGVVTIQGSTVNIIPPIV